MKQFDVVLGEQAIDDISQIYEWIYEASLNAVTAQKFTDRILVACKKIGNAS